MRDINVWYKLLSSDFFGFDKLTPSTKKKSQKIWSKRKKGVKQSSMLRGKALLDYRKMIVESIDDE